MGLFFKFKILQKYLNIDRLSADISPIISHRKKIMTDLNSSENFTKENYNLEAILVVVIQVKKKLVKKSIIGQYLVKNDNRSKKTVTDSNFLDNSTLEKMKF